MLRKLQARIGIATRLRDLGVSRDILASASHQVMRERGMANNPRTVNGASEIEELLVAAW
jgi:alcohol dehydrogenase